MGRFSFSPPSGEKVEISATSWREVDASISSSEDAISDDDDTESFVSSDEEEEYPHPLGFPSYGKTRFFLDPPIESAQLVRRRLGFLKENDDDFLNDEHDSNSLAMQSFPPLSTYIDTKTAPTKSLLSYTLFNERLEDDDDDDLDGVTQLLKAARIVQDENNEQYAKFLAETRQASRQMMVMSKTSQLDLQSARQDMDLKRQQLEKEHQETHAEFMLLLKRDQEAADKILKQQQAEAKAREDAEQEKRHQEEKEEAERQRVADERQKKEQEKQQQAAESARKRDAEAKAAAEEEAKKTEYIAKAKKRVAQLVELRASVAPFEKSKNVSRRRLKMKKTVKGKVNTLSQDAGKIQTVANEVTQAILQAKEEDDQLKQQIRAGNKDITEEMIRGKRYLIDLLASDTMVRAQAEGFNGTRGDGFPLANMLALVSTQVKELLPILAAHIYTVCPTAIPTLPKVTKNESENELMESLGMAKGPDGEYETFDRFLTRTEGIISLVADIMASNPDSHQLLGGHNGAIEWLERFLGHLPPAPETMPLLTAPVLDAFLTGAGHMLANHYPEEFRKHLDVIMNDIVNRLDEGSLGAPSALRLKKSVKGGFDSFKTDLPSKAIPSLYNGGRGGGGGASGPSVSSGFGTSATNMGSSSMPKPASNPFGGGQQQVSSGFFASGGSSESGGSNPFGAPSASSGPTPFGGAQTTPVTQTAFESAPAPSSFGQPASSTTQQTSTPFGGGFGQQQQQQSSSFGQQSQASSGFGQQSSSNPSPFGVGSSTGFGTQGTQSNMQTSSSPSPFGTSGRSMQQTGFGVGTTSSNAPPFGQTSATTPFGQSNTASAFGSQNQPSMSTTSASPFGQQSYSSGFGGQTQPMGLNTTSPFGNVSNPFGAPSQNSTSNAFGSSTTPFGSGAQSTPFGGSQNTPFGGSQNTPFGSNQTTPFGSSQSTRFGGNQNASFGNTSPFGGGPFGGGGGNTSNKPPCKFYAQGKCKFGNNCRFSHDTPVTASGGSGGFNSNPFGGPRR